ncbi:MAG: phosphoenolpyruvate carboxylase [Hyphomonadaceae bacterium]|nr:phosphoenolpyruvate carboxylase [Hyphomonadaceae bacterium]
MARPNEAAALHAWCLKRLEEESPGARRDPMSAGVRSLAVALSDRLERGDIDVAALDALVKRISDAALRGRAMRLGEMSPAGDWRSAIEAALAPLKGASLEQVATALEPGRFGIVFTGHPTFSLPRTMRDALGALASGEAVDLAHLDHLPDAHITLADEHADVSAAIARAQEGLRALTTAVFDWLEQHFPDAPWWRLTPAPLRLSTWVGYDLDGRTDISWAQTISLRLQEKARQLEWYARALADAGVDDLHAHLSAAAAEALAQSSLFAAAGDDAAAIVTAANRLTAPAPERISTLAPEIAKLAELIAAECDGARRKALCVLRTEMAAFGLGVADVQLRVNAAQVRSAVQTDLGLSDQSEFFDRRAMTAAAERAAQVSAHKLNFATLFQERRTARRQLMLAAEVLRHIDADRPIRFLIAEIESPATIMSAIYLARLYGVAEHIDVSPLFETPEVLERGGRFMERLLDEPEYLAYVRQRGRLCVQYGFSDSGRFMGQLAAEMAIERLHVLLSRALAARGVRDVDVVIFDTHGESMGRGGYPGSMQERLDHLMTPWVRARLTHDGLRAVPESSFQGGDGFLHFQTQKLADNTLRAILAWALKPAAKVKDIFYDDINFSWDIYRGVKAWQEALFADKHYQAVLGSFGPNLLPSTGSRKTRRQSGASKDDIARSLRAIPHNAILQQLAAPANVSAGLGHVAAREPDRFAAHVAASPRLAQLVRMASAARALTSLSTLRTYAQILSPGFWTIRAARDGDDQNAETALRIAARLAQRGLDVDIDRLANALSSDRRRFDAVSRAFSPGPIGDQGFEHDLYVLHAVRMVLMMRGFALAARTPQFSPRHDISREDLIDQALELRFAEVADALGEIFPVVDEPPAAFRALHEPGEPAPQAGYPEITREIIAPLRAIDASIKRVTIGISHFYGAFG